MNKYFIKNLKNLKDIKDKNAILAKTYQKIKSFRIKFIENLKNQDKKFIFILGPCSIHDIKGAKEYADKLSDLNKKFGDKIFFIMRLYFEKPRTNIGWKGFISDPYIDNSNDIENGIYLARRLLIDINEMGIACATEFLNPIIANYISDLITWGAIGARTVESQIHREMASGLDLPIGFKNPTSGDLSITKNSIISASKSHHILDIDENGYVSIFKTKGNQDTHVVLRGSGNGSNYHLKDIINANNILQKNNKRNILIDCNHGNSKKNYEKQIDICLDIVNSYKKHPDVILGIMLESYLKDGNQPISRKLEYNCSITDSCLGWDKTKDLIQKVYELI